MITYAAGVWGHAAEKYNNKRLLTSFQRSYAIRAIRGFHTISAVSACALAQFMPLHLKIKETRLIEEVKRSGVHEAIPDDITLEGRVKPKHQLHPAQRQGITYSSVNTESEAHAWDSDTNIYTDGSKTESGVGASFIAYKNDGSVVQRKFKLNATCSVFQAELFAIDKALEWAEQRLKNSLTIFSDSLSSLHAIENRSNSHPLVVSIHARLHNLENNHSISFAWTKAHAGINGNEEADRLAKEATIQRRACEYNNFPLSHAKYNIKQTCRQEWNREYISAVQGSGTRLWLPTIDHAEKFVNAFGVSFEMTQVMTNHGYHLQYLNRFNIASNALCPCDKKNTQTIEHLIKQCPRYASIRAHYETMFGKHHANANTYDMELILSNDEVIESFKEFIKNIITTLKEFNSTP